MSSAVDRAPSGARVEPGELSEALARYERLRGVSLAPRVGVHDAHVQRFRLVERRRSEIAEQERRFSDEAWLRRNAWTGWEVRAALQDLLAEREREREMSTPEGRVRRYRRLFASEKRWLAVAVWNGACWSVHEAESFDLFGDDGWRAVIRGAHREFGSPPWSGVRVVTVKGTREAVDWYVDGLSGPPEGRTYGDGRELRALRALFDRRQVLASGCWVSSPEAMHDYEDVLGAGRKVAAHKLVFEYQFGPVPPGFLVRHKCDVRACFRPDHLEIGTHLDNMRDKVERGRTGFRSVADRVAADELRVLGRTLQ